MFHQSRRVQYREDVAYFLQALKKPDGEGTIYTKGFHRRYVEDTAQCALRRGLVGMGNAALRALEKHDAAKSGPFQPLSEN